MGNYTGLRCKIIVKEEFRPMIAMLMEEHLNWNDLNDCGFNYNFVDEYSRISRSSFIPYGMLCYMPDEWEDVVLVKNGEENYANATDSDGFDRQFNEETGYWAFQCSLKNYEDTIEKFFELILNNITEKVVHLEFFYEECVYSHRYDLVDGKIQCVSNKFIKYGYDYDDDKGWGY